MGRGMEKEAEKETGTRKQDFHAPPLSELNLSDGFLFGEVMRDEETCRTVLEIILGRPVSRVVYAVKEKSVEAGTNYHEYKGGRLDVYFRDEEDIRYSVDMQTKNRYNLPKRSRHYQGIMDVQMLPAGEIDYNKLCDSIIIFICTFDPFEKGRYLYTFESTCREEPGLVLPDGAVRIFLNTEGPGAPGENPVLAEFLRYVVDYNAPVVNPGVKKIKDRVEKVKREQEMEAKYMTSLTHAREVYEDGREEGLLAGKVQSVLDLLGDLGTVPEHLRERIAGEENPEVLGRMVRLAARAESLGDFEKKLRQLDSGE